MRLRVGVGIRIGIAPWPDGAAPHEPSDFTVVPAVRQRFGDATADLAEIAVEMQGKRLPYWKARCADGGSQCPGEQNVLRIEAVNIPFAHAQTLDNFVVDNIVVFFKIRTRPVLGGQQTAD
jgi:hypothetical protein